MRIHNQGVRGMGKIGVGIFWGLEVTSGGKANNTDTDWKRLETTNIYHFLDNIDIQHVSLHQTHC